VSPLSRGAANMTKIRILLVAHQRLLRAGLRLLIATKSDLEVIGETQDDRAAVTKTRHMTPDVVLLELEIPGTRSLTVIEQLLQQCPHTRVVVLSMHADVASARAALLAGSKGYVTTGAAPADLFTAIRTAAQGQSFVDPTVSGPLLHDLLGKRTARQAATPGSHLSLLSLREREALIWLAQGYTYRQIAEQMCVSVKSVETYRTRIGQKLELQSRADLIRFALASGLLTPESFPRPA
jgi:two-component system, NarL family, response regulator NreC